MHDAAEERGKALHLEARQYERGYAWIGVWEIEPDEWGNVPSPGREQTPLVSFAALTTRCCC